MQLVGDLDPQLVDHQIEKLVDDLNPFIHLPAMH
jgi:hypothetical protein